MTAGARYFVDNAGIIPQGADPRIPLSIERVHTHAMRLPFTFLLLLLVIASVATAQRTRNYVPRSIAGEAARARYAERGDLPAIRARTGDAASMLAARAKFEPDSGRVYHGVDGLTAEVTAYTTAMDSTTQPIIGKLYYEIPGAPTPRYSQLRAVLATERAIGRIPELSFDLTDGAIGTDSIIATTNRYDAVIDSLALICKAFGRRMFVRPGFEFNATWNGYHPYLYPLAFRKIVDRFRALGAADSVAFIWCYIPQAAADFDSSDGRGARWYPGDGYVDWFGIDLFFPEEFDITYPESDAFGITPRGKTELFLSLARAKGKPVLASEVSAATMNITADSTDGYNDWYTWFDPFFRFLDVHEEVKGFCYVNTNWANAWGNARIDGNAVIRGLYVDEMMNPWYIHLGDSLPTPPPPPPSLLAPTLAAPANGGLIAVSSPTLRWNGSNGAERYRIQLSTSATFASVLVDDSTQTGVQRPVGPLAIGTYYWRVLARAGAGASLVESPWSTVWSFTVTLPLPQAVTLVAPAQGEVLTDLSARLVWRAGAPAVDRYWVEVALDSLFATSIADSTITDTTVARTGLVDGMRVWWRVRAHNATGWGPFSESRVFVVHLEPSAVTGVTGDNGQTAIIAIAPNPSANRALVRFRTSMPGDVQMMVFDRLGRLLMQVPVGQLDRGEHAADLDVSALASGAYLVRIVASDAVATSIVRVVR